MATETTETHFADPRAVFTLTAPPEWDVDASGLDDGLLIATSQKPWTAGFRPNIVVTQVDLGEHPETPEATLADQRDAEEVMRRTLADYRLLHLDRERFGSPAVQGAKRSASYTNDDGTPVMMHQWVARTGGKEVAMTVTFATPDLPHWASGSWIIAKRLEWRAV
ncbi:hypothetical protein [Zhihengliuella halotolerans]|uniref:DUF1795 domain-containing protein n=1 Tax=Zhihengliuella halotolerans TaxID=370736 RepID=A0A4Q8AG24_9MICC|nr:hypothetical protein [Zhihengliuella halotolerans]RZU62695.1 hypothetical protein EV380_2297 [Zhihengliuella halotolerans]